MKTVVLAPNWVGDCVMAEPVVRALAASGREVSVLARRHLVPLVALFEGVTATVERGGGSGGSSGSSGGSLSGGNDAGATVEALRAGGFDEAVVLPNSFRSARLVHAAGIGRRFGYRGDLRGLLLAPAVHRPRGRRPQVEDYRELLAAMAVAAPATWVPRIELPESVVEAGRERLARARIDAGESPVLAHFPGAEWGGSKRWPRSSFAALATELRRRRPASRQLILAGPKEVWLAVRVYEESGRINPVIGPDLDLAGLAGVLAHLSALVTNDSGPMHLAAALGVPCVALFGPTDPRRTAPAGDGHVVLHRDLWCSPCFRRRCPLLHQRCLKGIEVDAVATRVEAVLARREGTATS